MRSARVALSKSMLTIRGASSGGSRLPTPAACTPGNPRILSRSVSTNAVAAPPSMNILSASISRAVSAWRGSKPLSSSSNRSTVRTSSPAPVSNTIDNAIWAATNPARRRLVAGETGRHRPASQDGSVTPGGSERRGAAADHADEQGQSQTGEDNRKVDGDGVEALHDTGGCGREQPQTDPGRREAQEQSTGGYHQTFDQRGADQSGHAGAERDPDGELPAPHHRAPDEEGHRVRARDDQHEQRRRDRHPDHRPHASEQCLFDQPDRRAPCLAIDLARDPGGVVSGLGNRRTLGHAPHETIPTGSRRYDQPHVDVGCRKREVIPHDRRHVVAPVPDRHRLAEGGPAGLVLECPRQRRADHGPGVTAQEPGDHAHRR